MDWLTSDKNDFNDLDTLSTYYAVDSSVYFSYERIGRIDLLLNICGGKIVFTPKIEQEIFGVSYPVDSTYSSSLSFNYVSAFDKWIKTPKNCFITSVSFNSHIDSISDCFSNSYRDCFYVANLDYCSVTSTLFNPSSWQLECLNKLKREADYEITKWAIFNSYNTVLLSNDQQIVKTAKALGCSVTGAVGILIQSVKKFIISFKEAENIYNIWSIKDKGTCIWRKIGNNKKLKEFKEIYK